MADITAPPAVLDLVARFGEHIDDYKSGNYNETQLRRDFLDPFFKALGWDIDNLAGYAEAYRDVVHEDKVMVAGAIKAPDYGFQVGGLRKFFLEAKKPSIRIKDAIHPAYQLRRYAWSAKLPLSILSDFEEFAVYDCRQKPDLNDPASKGRILYFTYDQYPEKWAEIAAIFSKEAILKGSFDKFATAAKGKRGTAEVDADFLATIEGWRADLARNLALRNPALSQRELNFAVQRVIDRLIFLRICEDRGIEDYERLKRAAEGGKGIYSRLVQLFQAADDRYNSGLFHFRREKNRHEGPDTLTPGLVIDDDLLRRLIRGLYYPDSPYEFRVFSADILGQVYEQFLGKVITLSPSHKASVEEKPEVKKAGGVYYTPTYIVDYIVRQTVGPLIEGKTPKQIEKIRVLDPACGSGSFLIGAYQFLLDWYHRYYTGHDPEKLAKGKNPVLIAAQGGGWALSIPERKRILLAHIHGVDIDSQAVEVTKLSLLLKVLEGETAQALQRELIQERVLPDLADNIKCGNSLIGSDFYAQPELPAMDADAHLRINVFDWDGKEGFAEIMKSGGFDAVIGNPPWGAELESSCLFYLRDHYAEVVARTVDSYIYFCAKAIKLKQEEGRVGFIIPSTVLNQTDSKLVRTLFVSHGLGHVVSLGQGIFGRKVLNTSTILITATKGSKSLVVSDLTKIPIENKSTALANCRTVIRSDWQKRVLADLHHTFFTGNLNESGLLQKLTKNHPPLVSFLKGSIARGVSPDIVAAHVLDHEKAKALNIEKELLRPSVSGPKIKRYRKWECDQFIINTSRETDIAKHPNAARYLKQFERQNSCPEVRSGRHPYWALHRPRDPSIFESPKFIGLTTSKTIELIHDSSIGAYVTDAMYVFQTRDGVDPNVVLGILQSRFFLWLYRIANEGEARVIPQIKASKLEPLPLPERAVNPKNKADVAAHSRIVALVEKMLVLHPPRAAAKTPHEQAALDRQITAIDAQIDREVYALYGLTDEEIALVEAST